MNVFEMLKRIAQKTTYDPGTDAHREEMLGHLNEAQNEVFSAEAWNFATRESKLAVYGDVVVSATIVAGTPNVNDASGLGVFADWMQGQLIELEGVDHYILDVVSTTVLRLAENYPNNVTGGAAKVKQRFITLPGDCEQVVSIGRRSGVSPGSTDGEHEPLSRGSDRQWNLDLSQVGSPSMWVPGDDVSIAPRHVAPAVAVSAGGTLPVGDIKVVVTHHDMHGRHSAPTPPVTVTTTATDKTLTITLETLGTARTLGIRRAIWFSVPGTHSFRLLEENIDESVTTRVITALPVTNWQLLDRVPRQDGNYQTFRLYPRQDADMTLTLTYRRRPEPLVEDADTPTIPGPFHEYVVNRVLMDEGWVTLNSPTMARAYAAKVHRQFRAMAQRHLDKAPKPIVKGGSGMRRSSRVDRYLNAEYFDRN